MSTSPAASADFLTAHLSPGRIGRDALRALAWAFGLALAIFPLFWLGYLWW